MLPPRLPEGVVPPGGNAQPPPAAGQPQAAPQQPPPQEAPQAAAPEGGPLTAGEDPAEATKGPNKTSSYNTPGDPAKVASESQQIVTRAMQILHHPSSRDQVANKLQNSPDHVQAVATQTTAIMHKIDSMARSEGMEIDYGARIKGGQGVVKEVGDISANIGKPLSAEDSELAYSLSVQDYLKDEIKTGNIDESELNQSVTEGMKGLDEDQFNKVNNDVKRVGEIAEKHTAKNK